jgi:hypothetical protein
MRKIRLPLGHRKEVLKVEIGKEISLSSRIYTMKDIYEEAMSRCYLKTFKDEGRDYLSRREILGNNL